MEPSSPPCATPLAPPASSEDTADPATHPGFSRRAALALAAITLVGAALRLALAWGRPRVNDEVGTLLNLRLDTGYLLTHFSGWLTMNYFIVVEKGVAALTGSTGWPLDVLPLLGGVACIPLTASLARRLGGPRLGLIAAALTAGNPYLVRFSPVIRAYAPLAALAVWAVDRFFRWRERRTWPAGMAAAAVVLALLLMHPNGIYVVAGLGVLAGIEAAGALRRGAAAERRAYLAGLLTLAVPMAVAGLLTLLAYLPLAHDVRVFEQKWATSPPTSLAYLPAVLADYFGSGFAVFVPGGLLLAGVWSATQARPRLLPLCLLAGLSPVFVSLKGVSHYPWAYARFQIYCVPLLLILMAEGIDWLATRVAGRTAWGAAMAAGVLTAVAILAFGPLMGQVFEEKRQSMAYPAVAAYLRSQRRAGEPVVVEGTMPHLAMVPLLPRDADAPIRAEDFVVQGRTLADTGHVFFVAPSVPPLGEPGARRVFGDLQVVVYTGGVGKVCADLRADLARAGSGRVIDSEHADTYGLLALLDKQRPGDGSGPTAREWRLLARLCKAHNRRFLFMPPQMRALENAGPAPDAASGRDKPVEDD